MTPFQSLLALVRMSFTDPRQTTRVMTGWNIAPSLLWQALIAVVAVTVAIEYLLLMLFGAAEPLPPSGDALTDQIMQTFETLYANPLYMAATQLGLMVITITSIHVIGRGFGGKGSHEDVLVMMVWFQLLVLGLQMLQLAVSVIMPPLAGFVGIGTLAAFFYLLTMFVAELHGFRSPGLVLAGLILCSIAVLFGLSLVAAMFGGLFG